MSLLKLFLSGLLIAGGLILGAFTLHGYFDPQWAQKQQMQAAVPREPQPAAQSINSIQTRNRFVSSRGEQANAGDRQPAPTPVAVSPTPGTTAKPADSKLVAKPPPQKKKMAEKPKTAPPQQASVWPWNLFNN
jgi:hypothetical protein